MSQSTNPLLTPLKEAAYFARYQAKPLLTIAILLSIPSWVIYYSAPEVPSDSGPSTTMVLSQLVVAAIGVVQFAAALLFIHHQVQDSPISPSQAINLAAKRIGPLLLMNFIMALAVATGLMLLVLPGLYIAYKLLFAEFFLLFHQQGVMQSLRSSYRENTLLTDQLLPPLLAWGCCMLASSVLHQQLLEPDGANLVIHVLFEGLSLLLSIWGWALIYRLYQCHIAPSQAPKAVNKPRSESTDQDAIDDN